MLPSSHGVVAISNEHVELLYEDCCQTVASNAYRTRSIYRLIALINDQLYDAF